MASNSCRWIRWHEDTTATLAQTPLERPAAAPARCFKQVRQLTDSQTTPAVVMTTRYMMASAAHRYLARVGKLAVFREFRQISNNDSGK